MNNKKIGNLIAALAFLILIMPACKARKQAQQTKAEARVIPPPAKEFSLSDSIHSYRFTYRTMSAKIRTEFNASDGSEIAFQTTMRAVHDSAIWMSITPGLGVEAARILLTRDSIKILNKLTKQYAIEPYSFLLKYTEADISFEVLQNIFTGNMAFTGDSLITDSITQVYYAHSSRERTLQEVTINKMFRVLATIVTEKTTFDKLTVRYENFAAVEDGGMLPYDVKIEAVSRAKSASLLLNYTHVVINTPVELKFSIPTGYTKINN